MSTQNWLPGQACLWKKGSLCSQQSFVCCALTCIGTAVQSTYHIRRNCQRLALPLDSSSLRSLYSLLKAVRVLSFSGVTTTRTRTPACVLLLVTNSTQLRTSIQTQLTSQLNRAPRRAAARSVKFHGWGRKKGFLLPHLVTASPVESRPNFGDAVEDEKCK